MTYEQYHRMMLEERAERPIEDRFVMQPWPPKDNVDCVTTKNDLEHDVYVCGSLATDAVREVAEAIRELGADVFDDWHSAHKEADQLLWSYHRDWRGHSVKEALRGPVATMIRDLDKRHIDASKIMVLCAPAGKSAHMELGYAIGREKPTIYYYPEEPDRFDIMVGMVDEVCIGIEDLIRTIGRYL